MIGREAIYLLPWSFAGMILAAFVALRVRARGAGFFLALGLPALLVFNLQPLLGPTGQPHWSMAGWLFLFPLLGWLVAGAAQPWRWVMGGLTATSTIVLVVGALLFADAYRLFGRFDGIETFAAESMPWSGVRTALEGSGLLDRPGTFLAAMNWRDTAKFAESMRRPVVALGDDPRGFAYLSTPRDHIGDDAVIAVLPDELAWVTARIAPMFASVETIGTYPTLRDGVHAFDITVLIARTLHDPPRRRYGLP